MQTGNLAKMIHEQVLSLPISPVMSDEEAARVVEIINGFKP